MTLTENDLRRIEQSPRPRVLLRQLRLSATRLRIVAEPAPQLFLWADWPGWFHCPHLHCSLFVGSCVARQLENERQLERRKVRSGSDGDTARKRGRAPEYPLCQTSVCALGREIRGRLGDAAAGRVGAARLAAIGEGR